jgi:hypothetical protein
MFLHVGRNPRKISGKVANVLVEFRNGKFPITSQRRCRFILIFSINFLLQWGPCILEIEFEVAIWMSLLQDRVYLWDLALRTVDFSFVLSELGTDLCCF